MLNQQFRFFRNWESVLRARSRVTFPSSFLRYSSDLAACMVVSKKSTISSVSLFPVVCKKKLAISCSFFCSLCLLSMKRYSSKDTEARPGPSKRRCVSHSTFKKWQNELDKEFQAMSWLDCEVSGAKITKLACKICRKFETKIVGRRNYSNKWVVGAESVRISNIKDHAKTDQHAHAMMLLKKEHAKAAGLGPCSYAPIAKALYELPEDAKASLRKKFDIAHFVATEKLSFNKYSKICELEAHHGVNIGSTYVNEVAGKTFCHYIAETKRKELLTCLTQAQYFSLLMDGSTDVANVDDEIFLVLWCDNNCNEKVKTKMNFFSVARPKEVSGQGLFDCMECALTKLGVSGINSEACKHLIGIGTDGASANIAAAGVKGLVEDKVPWIFWMWCLAHRVELAIKNALSQTSFSLVDEMLLRLYYIYEKSPKKCRQLVEIVNDLRDCLTLDDKGIKPVRASGSWWVTHKLNAMKRVISKYGAYTSHLTALSEDHSVNSDNRAKLKGYCRKWSDAKYLLGCAFFVDLLSPCAITSKQLQSDDLDVLAAFMSILKTVKEIKKLRSLSLEKWPTYSSILKNINIENGEKTYQCQALRNYDSATDHFMSQHKQLCLAILST